MRLLDIWGHELFARETPDSPGGATPPVPGAGEAVPVDPSATTPSGATPPVAGDDGPGPIPYARFAEVNSQFRDLKEEIQPYRDLSESGYDADNLQRLATWEQEYMQDPVGTWLRQAAEIDSLPDEVKAAIAAASESAASTQGATPADGTPPQQTAPQADDELRRQVAELAADRDARTAREQEEAVTAFYDGLVSAWKQLDEAQGLVDPVTGKSNTPEEAMHAHLAMAAPNATRAEDILRGARETWLSVREATLATMVRPPGAGGTVPRTVPGSGAGAGAPPVQPKTLAEARRAALADPQFAGQE